MRIMRVLLTFVAVSLVAAHAAFAQSAISGVVKDTSGAVLPGVTVEASSPALIEGTRTAVTDSAGQYSPDIAVGAAQYVGSIYDQGGYIYAAGMVISFTPCAFVIAEHTKDFDRISNVVRYEGEHLVLYHNDRKRFQATADHSKGGGHPILQ